MKEIKRLGASAEFLNHPDGYLILQLQDFDGGPFDLQPRIDSTGIYLPAPNAPAYRVQVSGANPEVIERFGKALLTLARNQRKGEDGDGE